MDSQKFFSASLFPDPSTLEQSSRQKRQIVHNDNLVKKEREDEILAFGYECKIYNDQKIAVKIENGSYMIPWKSLESSKNYMDRYDVRHLIQDKELLHVSEKAVIDKGFDHERYADLDYNIEYEEASGIKRKSKASEIPYTYSDDVRDNKKAKPNQLATPPNSRVLSEIEKKLMSKYKTSDSMIVPTTMEQAEIIDATSKQINSVKKDRNLLEIQVQVRNSRNKLYSFLNKQDPLYPFYKHVGWISSSGLAMYGGDSDSENTDDEEESKSNNSTNPPPLEVQHTIEKTAEFIAKSSSDLEQHLRSKKGHEAKFGFLNPGNPYYEYFKSKVADKKNVAIK